MDAATSLESQGISASVVDLRVVNPLDTTAVNTDVLETGRLLVAEGDWLSCGIASEVITRAVTELPLGSLKVAPARIGLQDAPAPTSSALEKNYFPTVDKVITTAIDMVNRRQ
jgi:pyruvate dehydrogenase E1 component beta subunit